ncbi:F-type H+-transporting ATPase subunit alpha [Nitrosomonas cryotolerans]|uniref:ATP synthase subunit alpha n=1 Tax=Nitrosomonas cryotolerans ATCC 49181 TaxID=1131553 RepID=A0A1N6HS70_9PROT|nr:F0F1 ATP synthase subunit alpha [Nitrosomonas cryotolerans]SFP95665.1 F-type H+-transporting ATPase subunit alpha [Nitrosomonas cryotolerans]SIO22612.1 F-type H+-transporting ATPase subunit alpha [Nitrosomonas cryotolerans ATCC 49181]
MPDNVMVSTDSQADSPLAKQAVWLSDYQYGLRLSEQGTVISVGDGIAWIDGLPSACMDEVINLEDGSSALVFHLAHDRVGAILLRQTKQLAAGTSVYLTGERLSIGVGNGLLGRVIDPLGVPLDSAGSISFTAHRKLDVRSPPIIARDFVVQPMYTGNKIVDTLIPIGKGQRQLIIGDNGCGKSALAIDAVINQRGKNVFCVYVLIGQKRSAVVNTIETLRRESALAYTTVLVAEATAMSGLKYLAPFAGCAVAEGWMATGQDTLIVYDDLSTHARSYRELSLLLRRPPGREAYPGDIFYLHSRLLERSTCLSAREGGGSMTALPIVETEQGEIASYIPTNLISITDGQIYFDHQLFVRGFLPAIDVTRSVSRIGGNAQHPNIKKEAGRMKLDYLQFLELEVFTRFGSRLEAGMEARIRRGQVLREMLKQELLTPLTIEFQMAWLVAYNEGLFDQIELEQVSAYLIKLQELVERASLSIEEGRDQWKILLHAWLK